MSKKVKIASLFTGVGMAELGFEAAFGKENVDHVAFAEFDKYSSMVLSHRFPNVPNFGDITKIDWSAFPKCDILHASPPCQAFSVAGKRKGMADHRGEPLWEAYYKCLEVVRPPIITMEEVKGLLSMEKGATWQGILDRFASIGYTVKWKVLNALDYGVPQRRERIILVGFLDPKAAEAFQFPEPQPRTKKLKDVLQPESEVDVKHYLKHEAVLKLLSNMSEEQIGKLLSTLDTCQTNGVGIVARLNKSQDGKVFDPNGVSQCLSAGHFNTQKIPVAINRSVIVPREDGTATAQTASQYTGLDNHGARTGVAVIHQNTSKHVSVREDDTNTLRAGESKDVRFIAAVRKERIAGWSVDSERAIPFQGDAKRSTVPEAILNTTENSGVTALSVGHASSVKVIVTAELRRQGTLTEREVAPTLRAESKRGDDECRVIVSATGEDNKPYVIVREATKKGYAVAYDGDSINLSCPNSKTRRGRVGHQVANTLDCSCNQAVFIEKLLVIRRLTTIETARLMGLPDGWCAVPMPNGKTMSDSQQYRQHGNGLVTNVIASVAEKIAPLR